jgi:DNA adenine methylase
MQEIKLRSPLRYPGGKQRALKQILEMFPDSAKEYREPLVGGGSVYLQARSIDFARRYWINDKFEELISFWRTVQDPGMCTQLQKDLSHLHSSFHSTKEIKEYFQQARKANSGSSDNLMYKDAILFFFFNRVSFSGTTLAGGFSSAASINRFTASSIHRLEVLPAALAGTRITNLDFEEVILEPGEDVFIFLDPPYYKASKLYGRHGTLHAFDHQKLADCLRQSSHRFLVTYDDCEEIRQLYRWAQIKPWSLRYGMNNCNSQRASKLGSELFISNH